LLATYNGENYLSEQIDSILNQTYKNWRLLISDNGSSDNTVSIIREYQKKKPKQIIFYKNQEGQKSAKQNFSFHTSSSS
jgi:glycosyltransferase involved in cell wall biosynthesis